MRYAIVTGGAVTNVIVLRETNVVDFPGAVALHDRPVGIGDTYSESKFWRDGEELLTSDEEIAAMQTAATARPGTPRAARGRALPPANSVKQTARCTLPVAAAT